MIRPPCPPDPLAQIGEHVVVHGDGERLDLDREDVLYAEAETTRREVTPSRQLGSVRPRSAQVVLDCARSQSASGAAVSTIEGVDSAMARRRAELTYRPRLAPGTPSSSAAREARLGVGCSEASEQITSMTRSGASRASTPASRHPSRSPRVRFTPSTTTGVADAKAQPRRSQSRRGVGRHADGLLRRQSPARRSAESSVFDPNRTQPAARYCRRSCKRRLADAGQPGEDQPATGRTHCQTGRRTDDGGRGGADPHVRSTAVQRPAHPQSPLRRGAEGGQGRVNFGWSQVACEQVRDGALGRFGVDRVVSRARSSHPPPRSGARLRRRALGGRYRTAGSCRS